MESEFAGYDTIYELTYTSFGTSLYSFRSFTTTLSRPYSDAAAHHKAGVQRVSSSQRHDATVIVAFFAGAATITTTLACRREHVS